MTIAMCYVSPEVVVLGADSTASISVPPGGFHFFNHAQKLFEIGEGSTVAALVWGLGGLPSSSHRTLFAELGDDLAAKPPADVNEVAQRWAGRFWTAYSTELSASIARCAALDSMGTFNAGAPVPGARSEAEEKEYQQLRMGLVVGFCIGGYVPPNRSPSAFTVVFDPLQGPPAPLPVTGAGFWGAPNMIQRLIFGSDPGLKGDIVNSGKWSGTVPELEAILGRHTLFHPMLPLRDAIDFVHACIYSTIKAFKFSNLSQICGGPIELGVIRTDRKFHWVRHKEWDAALSEGALDDRR